MSVHRDLGRSNGTVTCFTCGLSWKAGTPAPAICLHENSGIMPNGRPAISSAGRLWGWNTIYGRDGDPSPYMTRFWIGRLRLHVFWRGDTDEDPHDHPWGFWTFPLRSYVEQVARPTVVEGQYRLWNELVEGWRWHYRPATHTHRVLGPFNRRRSSTIVTIVWRDPETGRRWGFLKQRDGKWCWQHWKDYLLKGGASAPCE